VQSCQAELLSEDTAWEVEAELAFHDDDPKAAIAALIEDRRRLHRKLALATAACSTGYTRGWRPRFG
jgi:hypothetical protein